MAPQALASGGFDYTQSVQWMNRSGGQGEDCLVLNVWTPGLADGGKRAVLFSIHGGGYPSGTGSNPAFDGQAHAEQDEVVVVTINHRLGSLGFLHLGGIVPEWSDSATAGMQDIVAALEWVRDNIESFGGDPGNVMIFGQCAYREAYPETPPSLLLAQLMSDRGLRGRSIRMAELKHAQGAAPVYMYRMDWPSQSHSGKFGAVHGVDVPLSFRNPAAWPLRGDGPEAHTMANRLGSAWIAFAKTGDPTMSELPAWPTYNPETRATMILDVESRVEEAPDAELLQQVGAGSE